MCFKCPAAAIHTNACIDDGIYAGNNVCLVTNNKLFSHFAMKIYSALSHWEIVERSRTNITQMDNRFNDIIYIFSFFVFV